MVKNSPVSAGDMGSVSDAGTKTPHAEGQLSLRAASKEACALKPRPSAAHV